MEAGCSESLRSAAPKRNAGMIIASGGGKKCPGEPGYAGHFGHSWDAPNAYLVPPTGISNCSYKLPSTAPSPPKVFTNKVFGSVRYATIRPKVNQFGVKKTQPLRQIHAKGEGDGIIQKEGRYVAR